MSHFLIVFADKFLNNSGVNSGDKFAGKFSNKSGVNLRISFWMILVWNLVWILVWNLVWILVWIWGWN